MSANIVTSENAQEFYASRLPQQVTPVAVEDETPAETPEADNESNNTQDKPKRKPIQPRINELVAERNQAKDEAEQAKQEAQAIKEELERIKKQLDVLNAPTPQKEQSDRPSRSQFATEDDYQEALTDWKVDQRLAQQAKEAAEARQKAVQAQLVENWKTRQDQVRAELEDYDTVLGGAEVEMPQFLLDAIVESDVGPRIAYYLAKNPAEAKGLVNKSPTAAVRELGKLEARLQREEKADTASASSVDKPKAPAPFDHLKGSSNPVGKEPDKMSYEEWKAARAAGKIK